MVKGNLFDLPTDRFHVGTMFFVAESITEQADEFELALRAFTRSLKRGAPFAAAFMRNSTGYTVNDRDFPALRVDRTAYDTDGQVIEYCRSTVRADRYRYSVELRER